MGTPAGDLTVRRAAGRRLEMSADDGERQERARGWLHMQVRGLGFKVDGGVVNINVHRRPTKIISRFQDRNETLGDDSATNVAGHENSAAYSPLKHLGAAWSVSRIRDLNRMLGDMSPPPTWTCTAGVPDITGPWRQH